MMTRPAFWVWLLSFTVLAGVFITASLILFRGSGSLPMYVAGSAIAAAVIGVPTALMIGKSMLADEGTPKT